MTTDSDALGRQLMDLFVHEVRDRSYDLESNLLGLENAADQETREDFRAKLLRIAHSLKGAAGLLAVRPIEEACHRMEDLLAAAGGEIDPARLDLLLAVTDAIGESGRMLERRESLANGPLEELLGKLPEEVQGASEQKRKAPSQKGAGTASSRHARSVAGMPVARPGDVDGSIRVPATRLDDMLYRSGEILVSRSRSRMRRSQAETLREMARALRHGANRRNRKVVPDEVLTGLEEGLRDLAKGLAEDGHHLQGAAVALDAEVRMARVQPFAQSCEGLGRLVRDMSAAEGKTVELSIEGGEIEIDRSILGVLHDVLRHLVRNAVGHGLETPESRRAAGKPETGRIVVSASLQGERLQVRVEDDGRGIDVEAIRKLVGSKLMLDEDDEPELLRQVFSPGVSTSSSVTRLSGRGIGLDVVRSSVERLSGTADVLHTPGGTAFIVTLPLTLATVRALLVKAAGLTFAVHSMSVRRLVRITPGTLTFTNGRNAVLYEGRTIPALDLSGWLGLSPQPRLENWATSTAIILGPESGEAALLVDEVAGEQELLARTLGTRLSRIRGYSGGTILPDGKVALLLNAAALLEAALARNDNAASYAHRGLENGTPVKTRVLVVDDTLAIRSLQKLILETAGYEVAMAENGSQAWEHLLAHGADAVIADVDMPVMDGFMLTQAIRKSEKFTDLPVILVTARDTPHDKERGMNAGADAYLTKSEFEQNHFLETLRQVV